MSRNTIITCAVVAALNLLSLALGAAAASFALGHATIASGPARALSGVSAASPLQRPTQRPPEKPPIHYSSLARKGLPNLCQSAGGCYPATLGPGRNVFAGPLPNR